MTVSDLIFEHNSRHPDSHFFEKETLAFFGENLDEMEVKDETVTIKDCYGKEHECFVLTTIQNDEILGSQPHTFFFEKGTFNEIFEG